MAQIKIANTKTEEPTAIGFKDINFDSLMFFKIGIKKDSVNIFFFKLLESFVLSQLKAVFAFSFYLFVYLSFLHLCLHLFWHRFFNQLTL